MSQPGGENGGGFGELLRWFRSASGLTQEELAARAGLSVRAIADIERGRTTRPYRGSVRLLADALELSSADRERFARGGRGSGEPVQPHRHHPHTSGMAVPLVVPRQLPAAAAHFTGRAPELAALAAVAAPAPPGGTPRVAVISGTAGVGKTALALRWAHAVAEDYPDGQLFLDLRGFGPLGGPILPADAIRGFLEALGVPTGHIPGSTQAQAGLYRSLLAGRRMLLVFDNARDTDQVRPLLPGDSGCLVVVTSRCPLMGLIATDGARPVPLGLPTRAAAVEMLGRMLGRDRVAAEPEAAADLITCCDRLPLALALVAARAATTPGLSLSELSRELRVTPRPLDALDTGEAAEGLRAAFGWSAVELSEPAARLFRLLGPHPAADVTAASVAALAGVPAARAGSLLRELTTQHLLAEESPGRYGFPHELLRAYATEQGRVMGGARHGGRETWIPATHPRASGQGGAERGARGAGHGSASADRAARLSVPAEPVLLSPAQPAL